MPRAWGGGLASRETQQEGRFYVWSLALFAISSVRFHYIGLLGGKLAIAWLFQFGYFLALPLFVDERHH